MTAIDEAQVETIDCKLGTVTLTTTADGWTISGAHAHHGTTFTYTVARCDCRENADSKRRRGWSWRGYSSMSNIGTRELCPKLPGHTGGCHQTRDHCPSKGHEVKVRALLDEIVRSYARPTPVGPAAVMKQVAPARPVRASTREREDYLAWLRENDPTADNPYERS